MPLVEPAAPMIDPPLFTQTTPESPVQAPLINNAETSFTTQMNIPTQPDALYEVPVSTFNNTEPQQNDKVSTVEDFLNTNGIAYKKYSNETGQCIIIEI